MTVIGLLGVLLLIGAGRAVHAQDNSFRPPPPALGEPGVPPDFNPNNDDDALEEVGDDGYRPPPPPAGVERPAPPPHSQRLAAMKPVEPEPLPREQSLLDVVDNLLNKGVVISGDAVLGVADVDLVYLKLSALLCAADKLSR